MSIVSKEAIILKLVERLRHHGSWCGETHVQKGTYLLQEMMKVPLGFDFILYKHGPFSFDLKDELTEMRADFLLGWQERPDPYRDSLVVAPLGEGLLEMDASEIKKYESHIEFIAGIINNKGVKDLEKLATAFYVRNTCGKLTLDEQARKLHEFKPHITEEESRQAVREIDGITAKVCNMG
jgi:hypothetical protein